MLLPLQILVNLRGVTGASAALSWTEANDTASITGAQSQAVSLAWTESDDVAALVVSVAVPVTASLAWTEDNDGCAITGTSEAKTPSEGSYGRPFKRTSWMRKRRTLLREAPKAVEIIEAVAEKFSAPERLDTLAIAVAELEINLAAADIGIMKTHIALLELELVRLIDEEDDELLMLL